MKDKNKIIGTSLIIILIIAIFASFVISAFNDSEIDRLNNEIDYLKYKEENNIWFEQLVLYWEYMHPFNENDSVTIFASYSNRELPDYIQVNHTIPKMISNINDSIKPVGTGVDVYFVYKWRFNMLSNGLIGAVEEYS